jgi:hypothetical protein
VGVLFLLLIQKLEDFYIMAKLTQVEVINPRVSVPSKLLFNRKWSNTAKIIAMRGIVQGCYETTEFPTVIQAEVHEIIEAYRKGEI